MAEGTEVVYDAITSAILESGREHRVGGDGPRFGLSRSSRARRPRQRYVSTGDGDKGSREEGLAEKLQGSPDTSLIGGETVGGQN
jgi:hypothetical protein